MSIAARRANAGDSVRARMVTSTTMAAPRIVAAVTKAGHGPEPLRPAQLGEAIRLARQLVDDLENAQLALGWHADRPERQP